MAQCVIIADDLTGANATGALIQKNNYSAYTIISYESLITNEYNDCDCILYPTYSRNINKEDAYIRVYNASMLLQSDDVKVYSKRIDSTLRGNIGSETDAIINSFKGERIAIVVPCFPESGRVVCGGYMLVNGIPLNQTEAAIDPISPINTSNVHDIFSKQTHHKIGMINLDDLKLGTEYVSNKIIQMKKDEIKIIIFDGATENDINTIADSVINSNIKYISVDPGPFTTALIRKTISNNIDFDNKILAVVGSVNPVTTKQVKVFLNSKDIANIYVNTKRFISRDEERRNEIERVLNAILNTNKNVISIIGDGVYVENRIDFKKYSLINNTNISNLSCIINNSFAEIVENALNKDCRFKALYLSGGDITVAICNRFKATGIKLLGEVLPLAAYGTIVGGRYNNMDIVTKGGMVGDDNAMLESVNFLKRKLVQKSR